jgi:hypothetical protein
MENGLAQIIDSAASILVLLPANPNFDTASAGLSLYMSVMDKKSVTVSCPSPITVGLNRIIGVQKITSELGNKNLTIKFKGYDANNIEKVSYDIVNGEFNLTVVPKAGFISPTKDQMDVSFSGVSADLVILVGGASDGDFPVLGSTELANSKIAHVGNRPLSSSREVMSFAKPGSTVSEVVANLIKDNQMQVDPDIATNLIMGIEEGTSNFAGGEVTPDTFEIFAYLLRSGGRRSGRVKLSPMGFPPGAIPTQPFSAPQTPQPVSVPVESVPQTLTPIKDVEGTDEHEQDINPPDDWLQPKVFKGANQPTQPTTFSENKG